MRNPITIIAALALTLVSGIATTPASAHGWDRGYHHGGNGTANAILGVVAGAGLGLAIGANRSQPAQSYGYAGGGYYQQPAYVPVPQPRPAPNGIVCQAWNGFTYIPVQRCGN